MRACAPPLLVTQRAHVAGDVAGVCAPPVAGGDSAGCCGVSRNIATDGGGLDNCALLGLQKTALSPFVF